MLIILWEKPKHEVKSTSSRDKIWRRPQNISAVLKVPRSRGAYIIHKWRKFGRTRVLLRDVVDFLVILKATGHHSSAAHHHPYSEAWWW